MQFTFDNTQSIKTEQSSTIVRSMRQSTVISSQRIENEQREADEKRQARVQHSSPKKKKPSMTQEERLAEAVVTEEYNRAYLEYYHQYELEKKRVRAEKKV